jgi:hypothetical protein
MPVDGGQREVTFVDTEVEVDQARKPLRAAVSCGVLLYADSLSISRDDDIAGV